MHHPNSGRLSGMLDLPPPYVLEFVNCDAQTTCTPSFQRLFAATAPRWLLLLRFLVFNSRSLTESYYLFHRVRRPAVTCAADGSMTFQGCLQRRSMHACVCILRVWVYVHVGTERCACRYVRIPDPMQASDYNRHPQTSRAVECSRAPEQR